MILVGCSCPWLLWPKTKENPVGAHKSIYPQDHQMAHWKQGFCRITNVLIGTPWFTQQHECNLENTGAPRKSKAQVLSGQPGYSKTPTMTKNTQEVIRQTRVELKWENAHIHLGDIRITRWYFDNQEACGTTKAQRIKSKYGNSHLLFLKTIRRNSET